LVSYLVEELGKENLVALTEVTSKNTTIHKDYIIEITNKGLYMVSIDGGFKRINRKIWITKTWAFVKITAAIINAVAIILIGAYSLKLSSKAYETEKENESIKRKIEVIEGVLKIIQDSD